MGEFGGLAGTAQKRLLSEFGDGAIGLAVVHLDGSPDRAGGYAVDTDAFFSEVFGECNGEVFDGGFGGGIVPQMGARFEGLDRCGGDNGAAYGQMFFSRLDRFEHADDIDLEGVPDLFHGEFFQGILGDLLGCV